MSEMKKLPACEAENDQIHSEEPCAWFFFFLVAGVQSTHCRDNVVFRCMQRFVDQVKLAEVPAFTQLIQNGQKIA
jgi:hypothetical protein